MGGNGLSRPGGNFGFKEVVPEQVPAQVSCWKNFTPPVGLSPDRIWGILLGLY